MWVLLPLIALFGLFAVTIPLARRGDTRRLAYFAGGFLVVIALCLWWADIEAERVVASGVFAPDAGFVDKMNILLAGAVGTVIAGVGLTISTIRARRRNDLKDRSNA